jgi:hypothetical protein
MAVIIDIADAVVTEMNGHTFSQTFTAARFYRPLFDLKDMSVLHVSVVPKAWSAEQAARGGNLEEHQIDIGVQKKVADDPGPPAVSMQQQMDALVTLVQEVSDFFRLRRLDAYPDAGCVKVENVPVFAPDHLQEYRQFTSVLTLTFRVFR